MDVLPTEAPARDGYEGASVLVSPAIQDDTLIELIPSLNISDYV